MWLFKKRKTSTKAPNTQSGKSNFNWSGACKTYQPKTWQDVDSKQLYLKEHNDVRDVFDKF